MRRLRWVLAVLAVAAGGLTAAVLEAQHPASTAVAQSSAAFLD